jgi:hypothetical protein
MKYLLLLYTYYAIGTAFAGFCAKVKKKQPSLPMMNPWLPGLLWPIVLPFGIGVIIAAFITSDE